MSPVHRFNRRLDLTAIQLIWRKQGPRCWRWNVSPSTPSGPCPSGIARVGSSGPPGPSERILQMRSPQLRSLTVTELTSNLIRKSLKSLVHALVQVQTIQAQKQLSYI